MPLLSRAAAEQKVLNMRFFLPSMKQVFPSGMMGDTYPRVAVCCTHFALDSTDLMTGHDICICCCSCQPELEKSTARVLNQQACLSGAFSTPSGKNLAKCVEIFTPGSAHAIATIDFVFVYLVLRLCDHPLYRLLSICPGTGQG